MRKERSTPEDVAAAQAMAGAPGAVPGTPASLPGRLHGRYASVKLMRGSVEIVLDCFDYEIEIETETFDATAHGEYWKTRVMGDQSWRARVRGYFRPSQAPYLASAGDITPQDPLPVRFTCYDGMTQNNSTRVFEGDGYITRARFTAPMAMVEQEMEIEGSSVALSIGI